MSTTASAYASAELPLLRDLASLIAELRDAELDSWQLRAALSAPDVECAFATVLIGLAERGSPAARALLAEFGALPE